MKSYSEIVEGYRKRQQTTVIDTIATGLTYADEIAVETGLLEETGLITDWFRHRRYSAAICFGRLMSSLIAMILLMMPASWSVSDIMWL